MDAGRLQELLHRTRVELDLLYEIGNAMRTTLKLDQILFIILTSVTAHDGLGFNRALLFLVNEKERLLEGTMGIGPDSAEEAARIWQEIESKRLGLDDLIAAYDHYKLSHTSLLDQTVRNLRIPIGEAGGVVGLTTSEGVPMEIMTQEVKGQLINDPVALTLHLEEFVTAPIRAKDRVVGVIVADNFITKEPISKDDIRILTLFANHAGLAIENSRLYEQTLLQANQDSLTHLWNHGHFQYLLGEELKKTQVSNMPVSLLMADIDDFKRYNDSCGHQGGDEALKAIAHLLRDTSRKQDWVARYGGEEFAIILPGTGKGEARAIAERMRAEIEQRQFTCKGIPGCPLLTISLGVATYPEDVRTKDALIHAADQALLAAKRSGKNRIQVS